MKMVGFKGNDNNAKMPETLFDKITETEKRSKKKKKRKRRGSWIKRTRS